MDGRANLKPIVTNLKKLSPKNRASRGLKSTVGGTNGLSTRHQPDVTQSAWHLVVRPFGTLEVRKLSNKSHAMSLFSLETSIDGKTHLIPEDHPGAMPEWLISELTKYISHTSVPRSTCS